MPKSPQQEHPYDSPTHAHPEPVPLVSPSDLVNPMLTVADVMTRDPRTVGPEATVLEAARIFREADCGVVPVVEGGRPVGVLTDRDAILALVDYERDLSVTPVGPIMTRDPATIGPDATLEDVLERLGEAGVRRLLVVDSGGRLVGLLSWADLVPHLSERGLGRAVGAVVRGR